MTLFAMFGRAGLYMCLYTSLRALSMLAGHVCAPVSIHVYIHVYRHIHPHLVRLGLSFCDLSQFADAHTPTSEHMYISVHMPMYTDAHTPMSMHPEGCIYTGHCTCICIYLCTRLHKCVDKFPRAGLVTYLSACPCTCSRTCAYTRLPKCLSRPSTCLYTCWYTHISDRMVYASVQFF